jgi:hypothetical protein
MPKALERRDRFFDDHSQMNEVLCKVLCHHLCVIIQAIHEFGIEPTLCAGKLDTLTR